MTDSVRERLIKHSRVAIIPGGLTKILQPLDMSVNKPFKEALRRLWKKWISDESTAEYTSGERRKNATMKRLHG